MDKSERKLAVLKAYGSTAFDERTPDERGFAETFGRELKPLLMQGIDLSMKVADERRDRRDRLIAVFLAVPALALLILLLKRIDQQVAILFLYAGIATGALFYRWALRRTPKTRDPNHAVVMSAVMGKFGCRLGMGAASLHPVRTKAPLVPVHSMLEMPPESLEGLFDGRIAFSAARVRTTSRQGKRTRETFKGWYLRVDLPFSFSGVTVIRETAWLHATTIDGRIRGLQDVSLEDSAFRKRFVTESNDQVEARVILAPDVIHHLATIKLDPYRSCGLALAFEGSFAHIWIPSRASALSDWRPLDPARLIEDLHEAFAELSEIRAFLRDIDAISESEGFRAQAARNAHAA